MFNATLNRLPPPPFVPEHQALRLTSDAQRPLPAGECRFILGPPQNGRCSCQSFHHKRSIPGSTCDCGHQACYHTIVHEDMLHATSAAAFEVRIKQLETEVLLERQMHEREVRLLREALQPYYQRLEGMRLKVSELEDRVESNYDEQVRLRDRVVALDDSSMSLERRVDDLDGRDEASGSLSKRRRIISRAPLTNGNVNEKSPRPSDDFLSPSHSSQASGPRLFAASRSPSPRTTSQYIAAHGTVACGIMAAPAEGEDQREEPRSSGILNLVHQMSQRTPPPYHDHDHDLTSSEILPRRKLSLPQEAQEVEEARSSGFLALDLAERLARRNGNGSRGDFTQAEARATTSASANNTASAPLGTLKISTETSLGDDQLRKRKRDRDATGRERGDLDALDVLANVSAVSAMAR